MDAFSQKKQMMIHTHCPGMEIVDLLESLDLHNTTFAGLQQKPGPHSHHPAALFSGAASHYPHPHCCKLTFFISNIFNSMVGVVEVQLS